MSDAASQPVQRWRIGTMGFGYADWRGVFYPEDLKPAQYLEFYARHFDAVEIDSTWHAAPPPGRFAHWASVTPDDFRFTVKTPRAITHDAGATDAIGPMKTFVESTLELGQKLAVILIQYPPALPGRAWPGVRKFIEALPEGPRYAVEFREETWFKDEVFDGLAKRGVCLVAADYNERPPPIVVTSDFVYLRLIGIHNTYEPKTHERIDRSERLKWWRDQVRKVHAGDAFAFLNNDYAGFSIATGDKLRRLVGQQVTSEQERLGTLF
jgi:uncharacterized protein YecE (DUF72 family)